jgi:hypothetical protein
MTTIEKLAALKDKIAVAFADFNTPPAEVKEELAAYEGALVTGEIVRAMPDLSAGATVTISSESGDIPIPDGEYELADGKKLKVEGGVIAEIEEPEAAAAPPAPELTAAIAQMETLKEENTSLKALIEDNKTAAELKYSELIAKLDKQAELTGLMYQAFTLQSEVPAVEPTQSPKVDDVQLSAQDKLQAQIAKIEQFKKQNKK